MIPTLALFVMAAVQVPGSSPTPYWQQRVAYEITASLDEPRGVLSGAERVTYVNNSPDTLHQFSLHLYLNAFRPGSRWSDADSVEGRRRFNDLKDPDFGFNHVSDVRIMGQAGDAGVSVCAGQHHRAVHAAGAHSRRAIR